MQQDSDCNIFLDRFDSKFLSHFGFSWFELPGPIGCNLGQFFVGLGVDVELLVWLMCLELLQHLKS